MQGISFFDKLKALRDKTRLDFIEGRSNSEWTMSIPRSFGGKKAKELIKELEAEGKVNCIRSGSGRLQRIKILDLGDAPKFATKAILRKKGALPAPAVETTPTAAISPSLKAKMDALAKHDEKRKKKILKKADKLRKQVLLEEEKKEKKWKDSLKRGEKNAARFHELMLKLKNTLINFPELFTDAGARRSRSGSVRDVRGEDEAFFVKTATGRKWKFIWDVKSSYYKKSPKGEEYGADVFNKEIIYYPGQEHVDGKRAIVVNRGRSDRQIVNEVVNYYLDQGLVELLHVKVLIIERFSDIRPPKI